MTFDVTKLTDRERMLLRGAAASVDATFRRAHLEFVMGTIDQEPSQQNCDDCIELINRILAASQEGAESP